MASSTPGQEVFGGQKKSQPAISATTQILTGAGRLHHVVVQAVGTGTVDFYDNTSTTGTPVASIPASVVAGSTFQFDIPMLTGIRVVVAASGPQLTVVYSGG